MKSRKGIILAIFFLMTYRTNYAQEISLEQGSFKVLIGEKTVDLRFTYDSLQVGKINMNLTMFKKR